MINRRALLISLCLFLGFPVNASDARGLFDVYARNRQQGQANYITSDFIALAYTMYLEKMSRQVEYEVLMPRFTSLVNGLVQRLEAQPEPSELYRKATAWVGLIRYLSKEQDREDLKPDQQKELELIQNVRERHMSPLLAMEIDYRRFDVPDEYAWDDDLKGYYRAIQLASSPLFHLSASRAAGIGEAQADQETQMAFLISDLIASDPDLAQHHAELERIMSELYGRADDVGPEVLHGLQPVYQAEGRETVAARLLEMGHAPAIVDTVIDPEALSEDQSQARVTLGWRLVPRRYTTDAACFQKLVYGQVGERTDQHVSFTTSIIQGRRLKGFPSAQEWLALLGSERAWQLLNEKGDTAYVGYEQAFAAARAELGRATGLEKIHEAQLRTWLADEDSDQRGESVLAYWTRLRRVGELYQKRSTTGVPKSLVFSLERKTACLEPATEFYRQLQAGVRYLDEVLPLQKEKDFDEALSRLIQMSERAEQQPWFEGEDAHFLNELDRSFKNLLGGEVDGPIVVYIHDNAARGELLAQATGLASICKMTSEGGEAIGARLSHRQMKVKAYEAPDDRSWRGMLMAARSLSPGMQFEE